MSIKQIFINCRDKYVSYKLFGHIINAMKSGKYKESYQDKKVEKGHCILSLMVEVLYDKCRDSCFPSELFNSLQLKELMDRFNKEHLTFKEIANILLEG